MFKGLRIQIVLLDPTIIGLYIKYVVNKFSKILNIETNYRYRYLVFMLRFF